MIRSISVLSALLASVSTAQAATVTVTFDADAGQHVDTRFSEDREALALPPGNWGAEFYAGTWQEAGFDVHYVVGDAFSFDGSDLQERQVLTDTVFFADTSFTSDPFVVSLKFSRLDSLAFSLESIDALVTSSSFWGAASFTPFNADGAPDPSSSIVLDLTVVTDNLRLSGIRSDGSAVTIPINTFLSSTWIRQAGGSVPFTGDGVIDSGDAPLSELSNLKELTVTLDWFAPAADLFRDSLAFSNAGDLFQTGFEQCLNVNPTGFGCDFPGFGSFDFYADAGNFWNFGTATTLDNFRFTLSDPAPVPVSGTLPLMLGALPLLGLVGLRRRRAAGM